MNDKIPQSLSEKQEFQRQQTINKVLRAIDDLQSQGCRLSIKNMMDYTGLSRSTFSKTHVRKVLSQYGYAPVGDETAAEPKAQTKKRKQSKKLREKDERIQRLTDENKALKDECELLRGRLFLLMQGQQNR
jgi:hypothetical protein